MPPPDVPSTRADTRQSRVRRLAEVARLLAVNVLLLSALALIVEAGTRAWGMRFPALAGSGLSDRALWVYDATKGWFHTPGSVGQSFMGGPDPALVHINGLGLRGREVARRAAPGLQRVLVLGDSFVFGVGVDEDHLFTTRLEQDLHGPGPYEVVNAGVSGYATDQEYLLFQELGPALAPQAVVLVMCDNDFEGNTQDFVYQRYSKPYFDLTPRGELLLRNSPTPRLSHAQRIKLWLGQHSNLWNAIRSRHSSGVFQPALGAFQVGEPRPNDNDPVALTAALVIASRDLAERLGARFVTLNTGHRDEKTPLFHALRPRLRAAGVDYLGLEAQLGDARIQHPEGNWDFPNDPHWNVDAHALAAAVVANYLSSRFAVQPDDSPSASVGARTGQGNLAGIPPGSTRRSP
jgi:GDSL-like Lipase/Acylhydrolase family